MNSQEILAEIKNSPFSMPCTHSSDVHLKRILLSMLDFMDVDSSEGIKGIFKAVPAFQRDNDKWTQKMKHDFIKNIIKGFRTTLMMYEINPTPSRIDPLIDCKILDGLQRVTAIYEFITGEFTVFGKTYQELVDMDIITGTSIPVTVKIYSFPSESEVIKFYISMNENISHSKEDIKKAEDVLAAINEDG